MSKQRTSIRGLGARLRTESSAAVAEHPIDAMSGEGPQVINIPLGAIAPNPDQPRKRFDESSIEELAQSIRDRGLLQPIIVKRIDEERYLLVAGERRFRASERAGLKKIRALVTEGDELEIAIVENLQREDLRPLEEADALGRLAAHHHYTQDQLAKVVGKSRVVVTETLSLLDLPETIKGECRTSDIGSKSQLLQVVREPDREKRLALWEAIKTGRLTVREARKARQDGPARGRPKHETKSYTTTEPAAVVTVRMKIANPTEDDFRDAIAAALREHEKHASAKRRGRANP